MIRSVIIGLCLTVTFACSCHTQDGGQAVQPSDEPQAVNDPSRDPSGDVRPSGPRNVLWLGPGWNLGNQMDAFWTYGDNKDMPDEKAWGNGTATQALFNRLKELGFNSVRIPITWLRKIGPAPDYTLDPDWLERVSELVGMAENAGLNVIINIHHDECNKDGHWLDVLKATNDPSYNTQVKQKLSAVWKQIAQKFSSKGEFLIFESVNEIQDGGWGWSDAFKANPALQCNTLNEWNRVFVETVRSEGGNNATRWLGVPTYAASPSWAEYMAVPSDPAGKVMVSVHFYDPDGYTISKEQYSDWGHAGQKGKKADWGDEDHVRQTFKALRERFIDKGVPVYIGEFGCSKRDISDSRAWKFYLYYLEYVAKAAASEGLPAFVWDNGAEGFGQECHGYLRHDTGEYFADSEAPVSVILRAYNDNGRTLQDVYDSI